MKIGVVTFPGSNSDTDLVYVWKEILGQNTVALWHKDVDLQGCDLICLPGGFAHGDYLRTGAIARFSPIMKEVIRHAEKGGYVWGICNGFQILTEAGLLPGVLLRNSGVRFVCKNVHIKADNNNAAITKYLKQEVYWIPIAHGEGNYYCNDETLKQIESEGQILFRYTDANGDVADNANPNGSLNNIAGICNLQKNVWGMMPHPERAADHFLSNQSGKAFFESILNAIG